MHDIRSCTLLVLGKRSKTDNTQIATKYTNKLTRALYGQECDVRTHNGMQMLLSTEKHWPLFFNHQIP